MIARSVRVLSILLLAGCAATLPPSASAPVGPLQFIDLPTFDARLGQVLDSKPETVRVDFIDKVKPSQLPDRVNPWMTTVQNSGGEVKVVLPPGDLQPKGFPLLSLLPTLFNMLREHRADPPLQKSAQGYDAQIILKNDGSGDRMVDAIVFKRR